MCKKAKTKSPFCSSKSYYLARAYKSIEILKVHIHIYDVYIHKYVLKMAFIAYTIVVRLPITIGVYVDLCIQYIYICIHVMHMCMCVWKIQFE